MDIDSLQDVGVYITIVVLCAPTIGLIAGVMVVLENFAKKFWR